jgi:5-methylthioribose kinase
MNRHTSPQLDDISVKFKADDELKGAVQEMKWKFLNGAEAMVHGDLHTGSVMVTEDDTRAIDPEFAFYGPMGFDVGAIIANLLMAYCAQPGHGNDKNYGAWILEQAEMLWETFEREFAALCAGRNEENPGGDVINPRIGITEKMIDNRLAAIWQDTLGFAGCKMIRRIFGLAHVEDFESITDQDVRAKCERKALEFARRLLCERSKFKTIADVTKAIR